MSETITLNNDNVIKYQAHQAHIDRISAPSRNKGDAAAGRIHFSDRSKALSFAVEQLLRAPEVRMDKVVYFQRAIAGGQYRIDPEKIADNIIG